MGFWLLRQNNTSKVSYNPSKRCIATQDSSQFPPTLFSSLPSSHLSCIFSTSSLHSSPTLSLPLRLSLPSHKITGHLQTIPLILQLQSSVPTSFTFSLSQPRLSIIYAYVLLIWKPFDMLEKNNCHAGSKFFYLQSRK